MNPKSMIFTGISQLIYNFVESHFSMSSHHFVKEKQEPALLILADASFDENLVAQLLEWAPIVFVEDRCLPLINHNPIKIDYVIQCSMSDEELDSWIAFQENVQVLKIKLDNKIQETIQFLKSDNHEALSIVGHDCKLEQLILENEEKLNIIFYSSSYKVFSKEKHFKKWKEKNSKFEFNANDIQLTNLIAESKYYKVIDDGNVEVNASSKIIIKEYLIER